MFVPVSRVLLRAPLLPVAALTRAGRARFDEPLAAAALALTQPSLRATRTVAAERALGNYARRAAFRATPHGLWAGVALAQLGPRTRLRTDGARADLTVAWARLAALGRALLDEPTERAGARLRIAPSLLHDGERALWLAFGAGAEARQLEAELDEPLAAVLRAARDWTPWSEVRAQLAAAQPATEEALDEFLLLLVDDGLLVHDLTPPLVGPPPLAWMRRRLDGRWPALDDAARTLQSAAPPAERIHAARAALDELPGAGDGPELHAVLVHEPSSAVVSRTAIERAARLAPLLFRLQEALAPPVAERALDAASADALAATTEIFGAGALDLGAFARGDYGTPPAGASDGDGDGDGGSDDTGGGAGPRPGPLDSPRPAPSVELWAWLVEALLDCARAGADELHLDPAALDARLPAVETPPTFELLLAPSREPRGAPPGTGWLLGLHAPAGSSWGRFTAALGAPLLAALDELTALERRARPGEQRLDVAYTPSPALADLTTHPPLRGATLALSAWPDGETVTPAELALCADPSAREPLALRREAQPLAPSPLARVRSTTAPPGLFRLLVGWSLYRQHAPWALTFGALARLPRLPRVRLDGFVLAPASWRLPDARSSAALRRWRRAEGVPRHVQVGREDELLLIDLDAPGAAAELARRDAAERVYEIWPPLADVVDGGGRRIELVAAIAQVPDDSDDNDGNGDDNDGNGDDNDGDGDGDDDDNDGDGDDNDGNGDRARAAAVRAGIAAVARAGRVDPPRRRAPATGWRTLKLFGAADRADRLLAGVVAPLVDELRAARLVDGWFFLRYVDGPGRRDHLRLRLHLTGDADTGADGDADADAALTRALARRLAPARAAGDVVTVEHAEYHRELARYGAAAMEKIERVFESDSALVCTLVAGDEAADLPELLVRSFDALATGLGLELAARHALARRRRAAELPPHPSGDDPLAAEYRARQAPLHAVLAAPPTPPFAAHIDRLRALSLPDPEAVLAPLLHLAAVRLAGPHRFEEGRALYLWERALEGRLRRR